MITKWAGESRLVEVDFSRKLSADEVLDSATAREIETADLTLSTPTINTEIWTIEGKAVPIGKAAFCIVQGGTAGTEYAVRIEAVTDDGQTLMRQITVRVI